MSIWSRLKRLEREHQKCHICGKTVHLKDAASMGYQDWWLLLPEDDPMRKYPMHAYASLWHQVLHFHHECLDAAGIEYAQPREGYWYRATPTAKKARAKK